MNPEREQAPAETVTSSIQSDSGLSATPLEAPPQTASFMMMAAFALALVITLTMVLMLRRGYTR